jgi:hypothetical protein
VVQFLRYFLKDMCPVQVLLNCVMSKGDAFSLYVYVNQTTTEVSECLAIVEPVIWLFDCSSCAGFGGSREYDERHFEFIIESRVNRDQVKGVPHEQLVVIGNGEEQSIVCLIQRPREVGQCSFDDPTIALDTLHGINLAYCPSKPGGVSV